MTTDHYALTRDGRFISPTPRSREHCEAFLSGCKPGTTEMVAIVPLAEIDRLRAIEAELDQTQDDLVYALHTRNLVLERAAAEVLPGPDGQDDIDRRALIERWVDEAHDEAGMTPRPLPSVEMLRQLGPNVGEVIRDLNRLRAIESAARYFMTAPNRAVEENAHSVLFCALKLCGPDGCADCKDPDA